MTALDLLRGLEERGATFRPDGDRLRVNAPPEVLTPDVVASLAEHKSALLAILQDGTATTWPAGIPRPAIKLGCNCALCSPEAHGYESQVDAAQAIFPETVRSRTR